MQSNDMNTPKQPRQLETNTPTYNELLQDIARVEGQVESEDYMLYSPTKEQQVMDEVLDARVERVRAPNSTAKSQRPTAKADTANSPVDSGFHGVNKAAADTAFSHPLDDAALARETNGKVPLPDYASQGLNDYPVPPDNALADNDYDEQRHKHENQPYAPANLRAGGAAPKRDKPLDAYPTGDSAPFYEAPEEGGPSTPTEQQRAGMEAYDASPDDLDAPPS